MLVAVLVTGGGGTGWLGLDALFLAAGTLTVPVAVRAGRAPRGAPAELPAG
ncbi:hypothetical protein ABZX93_28730 [Streptomyces sp. NPDC006632]|uniref:hypothetical protein n=1 Tax=unclassified Streptomyces TaxID=2593676 RepID=UPI002E1AB4E9